MRVAEQLQMRLITPVWCLFLLAFMLLAPQGMALAGSALSGTVFEIQGSFGDAAAGRSLLFLAMREAESADPDMLVYRLGKNGHVEQLSSYTSKDNAHGIALEGDYLYLADGRFGLEVIDVSDPLSPRLAAFVELDGYSHKVVIHKHLAYVTSGFNGLHIIDISRPESPSLLSTFQAYPPPEDEAEDDGLFSADGEAITSGFGGMGADMNDDYDEDRNDFGGGDIDLSWEDYIRVEGALDISIDGHLVYLAYGSEGVVIVDVSGPKAPKKVSTTRVGKTVESVFLARKTLYVTTGLRGLQAVDVQRPAAPRRLGSVRSNCYPMDVVVSGNHAFVADGLCGGEGLFVIGVARPGVLKVSRKLSGKVVGVRLWGDALLAMGPEEMRMFRLTH